MESNSFWELFVLRISIFLYFMMTEDFCFELFILFPSSWTLKFLDLLVYILWSRILLSIYWKFRWNLCLRSLVDSCLPFFAFMSSSTIRNYFSCNCYLTGLDYTAFWELEFISFLILTFPMLRDFLPPLISLLVLGHLRCLICLLIKRLCVSSIY